MRGGDTVSYSTRYLDDAPHATVVHPADIGLIWRVRYWAATSGQQVPFDVPGFPFSESDALQALAAVPAEYPAWSKLTPCLKAGAFRKASVKLRVTYPLHIKTSTAERGSSLKSNQKEKQCQLP